MGCTDLYVSRINELMMYGWMGVYIVMRHHAFLAFGYMGGLGSTVMRTFIDYGLRGRRLVFLFELSAPGYVDRRSGEVPLMYVGFPDFHEVSVFLLSQSEVIFYQSSALHYCTCLLYLLTVGVWAKVPARTYYI